MVGKQFNLENVALNSFGKILQVFLLSALYNLNFSQLYWICIIRKLLTYKYLIILSMLYFRFNPQPERLLGQEDNPMHTLIDVR